jgi:hypothetical protein
MSIPISWARYTEALPELTPTTAQQHDGERHPNDRRRPAPVPLGHVDGHPERDRQRDPGVQVDQLPAEVEGRERPERVADQARGGRADERARLDRFPGRRVEAPDLTLHPVNVHRRASLTCVLMQ